MARDGILSGPVDLDGRGPSQPAHRLVEARRGLVVEHRVSGVVGSITSYNDQIVVLNDRGGIDRPLRVHPGGFLLDGEVVTLVAPQAAPQEPTMTASGSIAADARPARVARASRILVEGIHDAELVEKVWGADLRDVGVVVERLDGMDDLTTSCATSIRGPVGGSGCCSTTSSTARRSGGRPMRWATRTCS